MASAPDKRESELTTGEKLNDFMQKNRKIILFGFLAIVVTLTGFVVASFVRERIQANALTEVDALMQRHEELREFIGSEEPEALARHIELFVLLEDLAAFGRRNSGFAAARAYSVRADILWELENWAEAEEAWLEAARIAAKSYLAPISFFNAAVAAEELGNVESAIAHYNSAIDYGDIFPAAARAQFSVGRLEESRNNMQAAVEAYRKLLNSWPEDPVWPALAQSRIIILSE